MYNSSAYEKISADFYDAFYLKPQIVAIKSKLTSFPIMKLSYMKPYHVIAIIYYSGKVYYELEGFMGKVDSDFFLKGTHTTVFGSTSHIPTVGSPLGNVQLLGNWCETSVKIPSKIVKSLTAISTDTIKVELVDSKEKLKEDAKITIFLHINL